ncbi:MAG TPA: competence type IV pilus assembly protein ComGB [Ureibacillus sp.]|nr:competence type IV pilus assembly protein ComGB [Ureibacillus sp.]
MLQKVFNRYVPRKKEKIKQLPSLLDRISTLLSEGYTFSDSIHMLLPYHVDNHQYWHRIVEEKLRNGENIITIFKSFSIPEHYLISIQIAEANGDLAKTLRMIGKQMDFHEKMKKKLSKILIYPVFLILFLISIFVGFRTYFMPNIEQIVNSRTPSSDSTFAVSNIIVYFPEITILSLLIITILVILIFLLIKKQSITYQMKIFTTMPIIRYFFKMHLTKQFSRIIGSLLIGGFSLQQTLEILKEQRLNKYLEFVAVNIEKRIIFGDSLSIAVQTSGYFFPKFQEFIRHGEKSGYLGREMIIYSDLLDEKQQSLLKTAITFVQPLFFIIIALSIIAAYLSILLPMYNIIEII